MARKSVKRKSFGEINPFNNSNPVVKADDVEGLPVLVVGARGPYESKKFDNQYCVLTLAWAGDNDPRWPDLTPEQAAKYNEAEGWEEDGRRDLFLSYVGQRKTICEMFEAEPDTVLGPGTLQPVDVGSVSDMWMFVDVED